MSETREIRSFVYGREYLPTGLAGSSTCRLLIVTDDQIEVLRNLVNYAHQRRSWNDETIDDTRYYMPSDDDWDDIEALVADLEDKLMSDCDFVTLDSVNDRVGINNDTPAAALDVKGTPSFQARDSAGDVQMTLSGGYASLSLDTSILLEAPTITLDADAVVVDNLTFPATQVSNANVNALDDYEEGTCVVALTALTSGTITLKTANKTLSYTKIGRLVHVSGFLQVDSVSSPVGVLRMTGLPFTVASGVENRAAAALVAYNLAAGAVTWVVAQAGEGTSIMDIYKVAAGAIANLAGDVQANSTFVISLSYHAAT